MTDRKSSLHREVAEKITDMGYPEELGRAVSANLVSEISLERMLGYLYHAKPKTAEEIVDEMLAIMDDRDRWLKKKSAEYYNSRYNILLNEGLGVEGEEE